MKRKYGHDPILEVICEFQFKPAEAWNLTIPGLMYRELKNKFPTRRQCKIVAQQYQPSNDEPKQRITEIDRMQFVSEDGRSLIQTNPDFLSVNHLNPYPTWSEFEPMIRKGLDAYCKAAEPASIARVALRYINSIEIPSDSAELTNYFRIFPVSNAPLPQQYTSCIVGITSMVNEPGGQVKIQLTSVSGREGAISMLLDIEHHLESAEGLQVNQIIPWLEASHKYILDVFEASITDETRALFGDPCE